MLAVTKENKSHIKRQEVASGGGGRKQKRQLTRACAGSGSKPPRAGVVGRTCNARKNVFEASLG